MTRMLGADVAVAAQCELAEGPAWDASRGLLRWVDILDTVVQLPARQVTSAAFGGEDLSILYITTARENLTAGDLREQPHAGDTFACTPGVTGRLPYLFDD